MSQQTLHVPNAASPAGDKPALGDELGLVRFRLTLVIVATAVVSVAVSSAIAILVSAGPHSLFRPTLGIVPVPPAASCSPPSRSAAG